MLAAGVGCLNFQIQIHKNQFIMNLISEEKLQSESLKQFRIVNGQLDASFRNGARFAENELKNLAIEYAEWHRRVFHESFSQWCELSQQELFDKFLKTRNT